MAILPVYTYGQPVLRKRAKPVKEVSAELRKFVDDMFETMYHANGIGLAANQVGSLDRIIVIDISDLDEKEHEGVGEAATTETVSEGVKKLVLLNPEVVLETGKWKMEEGCLSIPDIRDDVERAEVVTVKYKDLDFNEQTIEASGLLGRVLLHEIDHLNGVLFIDRVGAVRRKLMTGRLNKIEKGNVDVRYPVVTAESIESPAR